MKTPFALHTRLSSALSKSVCLLLSATQLVVIAAPAQDPLLTASAGPKPNVVLTLDESGSMNWHMMPTEVGQLALKNISITTYNRRGTNACRNLTLQVVSPPELIPTNTGCYTTSTKTGNVTYQFYPKIHPGDHDGNGRNTSGVVDTNLTGYNSEGNVFAAQFRSAAFNGNYYNPDTIYEPWPAGMRNISAALLNSDGSIKAPSKTPIYPEGNSDGTASTATVDLVTTATTTNNWCATGMGKSGLAQVGTINGDPYHFCTSASRTFNPAVYFKLKSGQSGTSINDFDRIDINQITDTTLKEAQLKNFAIWFTYYRNRILTAKGAVALAFDNQKSNQFRLGWGSINNGQTTTDGYTSNTLRQGVRALSTAHKTNFFGWLRPLFANGGTPLLRSMKDIGEYYKTTKPYQTDPTTNGAALSCRRNYHILVTDGYWNDSSTQNVGNQDGSATGAVEYTAPDGFKYKYSAVSPYADNNSETLADVAMKYWRTDLINLTDNIPITDTAKTSPNDPSNNPAFWQHMVNFTVGLGVSGSIKNSPALGSFSWPKPVANEETTIDDLWHAAVNSRGKYLSARDPINFAKSLTNILSNITSTGGTISGVAVSRATLSADAVKFEPSFEPNKWSGELSAIGLNATNGSESSTLWRASQKVPGFAQRNLWTRSSGSTVEFLNGNLGGTTPLGHTQAGVAPTINADFVNYLRGDSSLEGNEAGKFRTRSTYTLSDGVTVKTNVLGDMVNSLPIYIKATDFGNRFLPAAVNGQNTGSAAYNAFLRTKRDRAGLVVVGANDGMLHGFRATDGVEMFGFIPQAVLKGESHPKSTSSTDLFGLARLADLNYEHQFYVDGQIAEGDISSCSSSNCNWKNIIIASTGGGGKSVFALDVTNNFAADSAAEPSVFSSGNFLWEIGASDTDLGYVMSTPDIGMLPNGKWVAVFGNGYDSASGKAVLFVVDAANGTIIKKISAGTATGTGLGGVRLVRDSQNIIRHAYAGDTQGNLWKFDMEKLALDLGGTALFQAKVNNTAQPITAAPNYALHPKKGLMVIVSTGMLYSGTDTASGQQQTIYGLWDQAPIGAASTSGAAIAMTSLTSKVVADPTSSASAFKIIDDSSSTAPTSSRGWRLPMLFSTGEQGIYMPRFLNGYTYVETVKPGQVETESCSIAQGSGYAYSLNTFTGAQPASPLIDINNDGKIDKAGDDFGVSKRDSVGQSQPVDEEGGCTGDNCPKGCFLTEGNNCDLKEKLNNTPDRYWRQIFWTIR